MKWFLFVIFVCFSLKIRHVTIDSAIRMSYVIKWKQISFLLSVFVYFNIFNNEIFITIEWHHKSCWLMILTIKICIVNKFYSSINTSWMAGCLLVYHIHWILSFFNRCFYTTKVDNDEKLNNLVEIVFGYWISWRKQQRLMQGTM